ncbi:ArsR/SmtB family transcription factor [Stygiobacter electus]|uniref:Metalloregulator ArsR/SmtB family transcription factor n=1 Tax=Stygiobacter electus TaxID=3032292 RepID=A0AAE3TCD6_9BACT|nr:metalloregulator ArsR/SmtB family transcription factor [Stygiobacter electus]MDF1611356.1 metalloregulator ArsR/SmtB family transcription factor [Stygiobacter electus]
MPKSVPSGKVHKRISNGQSCKVICFNVEKVNEVKKSLPTEKEFEELVGLYAALGSITRLKIIFSLAKSELCVCDISNVLGLSIPATSHQLKYLYEQKLLKYRNDGKMVYYSLNSEELISILKDDVQFIENSFME